MKYLGGKHLNGKKIAEIIRTFAGPDIFDKYLEPFCGSLGVFKHMTDYKKSIASDIQSDLIHLWKDLQSNTFVYPKKVTEEDWNKAKKMKSSALKAFIGFGCSFSGVYFSTYAQKYAGNSNRNFRLETIRSLEKIKPLIQKKNVKFYNKPYQKWKPENSLIYCDPPYKNTAGYNSSSFNHDEFWEIMREWSKNNMVVISEETAPDDFIAIWEKKKIRTVVKVRNNRFYSIEKLFVYKKYIKK